MDWFANPTSANTNTDNLINDKYSLLATIWPQLQSLCLFREPIL